MRLTYILALLLSSFVAGAQTNQPLPTGSVPISNTLYLAPDSTVWTGDEFTGLFVKVAKWNSVDSLFKLGYTKVQVDSAITAAGDPRYLRKDVNDSNGGNTLTLGSVATASDGTSWNWRQAYRNYLSRHPDSANNIVTAGSRDFNALTGAGIFRLGSGSSNQPGATGEWMVVNLYGDSDASAQLAIPITGTGVNNVIMWRSNQASPWRSIWHTGSFDPAAYVNTFGNQIAAGNKTWTGTNTYSMSTINRSSLVMQPIVSGGWSRGLVHRTMAGTNIWRSGAYGDETGLHYGYMGTDYFTPILKASDFGVVIGMKDSLAVPNVGLTVKNTPFIIESDNVLTLGSAPNRIIGGRGSAGSLLRFDDGVSALAAIIRSYASSGVQVELTKGGVSAAGAYTNTSDSTIKDLLLYDWSAVDSLAARSFTYRDNRDSGRVHVGYIAQEVRERLPGAVYESSETGLLSVDHVQVLIAKVALLEKRIKELESKMEQ